MKITPIKKISLSEEVAKQLQQQIASGKYTLGQKLPCESKLMEEFGVGRSSIREAVRVLANAGIVRVQQGLGTFVEFKNGAVLPWYERLRGAKGYELNEVRQLLELKIAEKAALNRTAKDITGLKKLLQCRYKAVIENDIEACIDADIRFHIAIADAAKNDILADLYKTIAAQIKRSFREVYHDTKVFLSRHDEHKTLLKSIIDKNPKKAWQCVAKITGQAI
ncbi:MAG: FadR family transcriptional regulator [Bacteroidetes bacterium]|nr:FadR family transcriptional regulator [Bacteroidota bacterium]